jgi:hypothetical protein
MTEPLLAFFRFLLRPIRLDQRDEQEIGIPLPRWAFHVDLAMLPISKGFDGGQAQPRAALEARFPLAAAVI